MSTLEFVSKPAVHAGMNRRTAILACIYSAIIGASWYLAYEIRFDFVVPEYQQEQRLNLLVWVVGIKLVALIWARQLGSMLTYFSVPDLMKLFWAMSASSVLLSLPRIFQAIPVTVPRGTLLIDFMLCFGGLCLGRLGTRLYRERLSSAKRSAAQGPKVQQQRIAIIGAGDAGATLAKEFIGFPARGFQPVMFFDDDPEKHGKLVHGVPVIGRPEELGNVRDGGSLAKAVIAMPSASAKRIREVVTVFTQYGVKVETLPTLEELASGKVKASRIRPVEVQDLLGRDPVDLDSAAIKEAIEGRVVMVTGAGGSIGGELCRQIAAWNPKRLLMVEQSEAALFIIEQELNETGLGAIAVPLVGDILDTERMEFIFSRYQPEVVFHAAAHKHVYLMERQPAEAIRNNVLGTRQLARIAAQHGTDAFVLISTDKAINPTSVMGATKRLAEIQLMAIHSLAGSNGSSLEGQKARATERQMPAVSRERDPSLISDAPTSVALPRVRHKQPTKFMAVRFGNVLGSSGSVIPIFKRQIANGGPVTVTHPDVTRYFMTIPEAVGLVLQSFVQGRGGEIFVLDMGQPVKIVDLAKQMIELSGFKPDDDIEIKFTGLKPGEKLFEELQHHTEAHQATQHPRIMRFVTNAMFSESGVRELEQRLYELDSNELKELLKRLVPEYTPFLD